MKGDRFTTFSCEWITIDDVSDQKCEAQTIEEFMKPDNIQKVFEYRCNKILQKCAMSIAQKAMAKEKSSFQIWNEEQNLGGIQDLAKAYGECTMMRLDIYFLSGIEHKVNAVILKEDSQ